MTANVANANVTLSDPDTDNDTLSDWWEMIWFGTVSQGPNDDPDGDVISNQQEQHFDMDPTLTTVTFGNAALVDEPAAPRLADTTMFFPNPGYSYDAPCGDLDDTAFASSFYLFAQPNPFDFGRPKNEWQDVDVYQARYKNYAERVLADTQSRSVFFEVDVLYSDFRDFDKQPPSALNTNDPYLVQNAADRNLDAELLKALKDAKTYPVMVLINGPEQYVNTDEIDIVNHAKFFIDVVYALGVPAAYVLGAEIPGGRFDKPRANRIISQIREHIRTDLDAGEWDIPIGVHTQGYDESHWPSEAQFLAYEFSWNPWCGYEKSTSELISEALDAINAQAQRGMGVHFLEYNMRVTGTAAINQTRALKNRFPYLNNNGKICLGISRSK